jgi:hypothetical protein
MKQAIKRNQYFSPLAQDLRCRIPVSVALTACLLSGVAHAVTIQTDQQQYAKQWQQEHGALTAAPPPALATFLAEHATKPVSHFDTLSTREGLAQLTHQYTTPPSEDLAVVNVDVEAGGRRIPVRIYQSKASKPRPGRAMRRHLAFCSLFTAAAI